MGLRQDRVADQVRDIIGRCLQGGQMNDPRLQSVAVTYVKVSPDLQVASIYFRCFEDTVDGKKVGEALNGSSSYFRKRLGEALKLRRVPALRFFFDETVESASRIEALLTQL